MKIGCHISVSKGYVKAGQEALALGGNTFQFFTRNPRGGQAKALDYEDLEALSEWMSAHGFEEIVAHGSYTMNLTSDKADTRAYALELFKDDLQRLDQMDKVIYVFHPGAHVKQGLDQGINHLINALNDSLKPDQKFWVCLEAMSGRGTEIGRNFQELKTIIDCVSNNEKLGVCLDTCHLYSSGYDLRGDLDGVVRSFDEIIGLDRLKAIHLNDSKTPFGSQKDRHEKIGQGSLGLETCLAIINHPDLKHLPFILETPQDRDGHKGEIDMLKSHYK